MTIKVHSLKDGTLIFVGGDPTRPTTFIRNDILTEGALGETPEELARKLESLAITVRETGLDVAKSNG